MRFLAFVTVFNCDKLKSYKPQSTNLQLLLSYTVSDNIYIEL